MDYVIYIWKEKHKFAKAVPTSCAVCCFSEFHGFVDDDRKYRVYAGKRLRCTHETTKHCGYISVIKNSVCSLFERKTDG